MVLVHRLSKILTLKVQGLIASIEDTFPEGEKYQTVYRSILRHMLEYIRENFPSLMEKFKKKSLTKYMIRKGFNKVATYSVSKKTSKKDANTGKPQDKMTYKEIMMKIITSEKKRVIAWILKYTLKYLEDEWKAEEKGKKNKEKYQKICQKLAEEVQKRIHD